MTEAAFQKAVIDLARLTGWHVAHFHDSRRVVKRDGRYIAIGDRDAAGFPDLVLVRDRLIVRELKTETGRLRPAQRVWIAALVAAGVDAAVWRPEDWPLIEQTLKPRGAAPVAAGQPAPHGAARGPATPSTSDALEVRS